MTQGTRKRSAYKEFELLEPEHYLNIAGNTGRGWHWLNFFAAVFAVVAIYEVILVFSEPHSIVRRIFLSDSNLVQRAIPISIVFCFFWCAFATLNRYLLSVSEKRPFGKEIIQEIVKNCTQLRIDDAEASLGGAGKYSRGILYNRIAEIISMAKSNSSAPLRTELIQQRWELQNQIRFSQYDPPRVLIWGMPMLGFIGTVIGVSISVGDFSAFLSQSGDTIEIGLIKDRLAGVASGLAFAFDTTLLGLAGSLIAMFLVSFVQNKEENVLSEIDSVSLLCLEAAAKYEKPTGGLPTSAESTGST